jgi:hypothetical protein
VVAARKPARERQEALEQLVARGDVAEAGVAPEEPLNARRSGLGGAGKWGAARGRRNCG